MEIRSFSLQRRNRTHIKIRQSNYARLLLKGPEGYQHTNRFQSCQNRTLLLLCEDIFSYTKNKDNKQLKFSLEDR